MPFQNAITFFFNSSAILLKILVAYKKLLLFELVEFVHESEEYRYLLMKVLTKVIVK